MGLVSQAVYDGGRHVLGYRWFSLSLSLSPLSFIFFSLSVLFNLDLFCFRVIPKSLMPKEVRKKIVIIHLLILFIEIWWLIYPFNFPDYWRDNWRSKSRIRNASTQSRNGSSSWCIYCIAWYFYFFPFPFSPPILFPFRKSWTSLKGNYLTFPLLAGGYGTLEELLEVITWAQLGIHEKPVQINKIKHKTI